MLAFFIRASLVVATPFILAHAFFSILIAGIREAFKEAAIEVEWELYSLRRSWANPLSDQDEDIE